MRFKINILSVLLIVTIILVSCSKDPKPANDQLDNYYFVKVGNIAMAMRVCGNINSDIAVVFVHGAPAERHKVERANVILARNREIL